MHMVNFHYLSKVGNIPVFQFRSQVGIGNNQNTVQYNTVLKVLLYCSTVGAKLILCGRSFKRETKLASTKLPLSASFVITHACRYVKIPHGIRVLGRPYITEERVHFSTGIRTRGT